jgi:hypothetical protein
MQSSESTAKEEAALIAFNICRSFSANDGMYPTGFAHDGVIQGNPVPVGSGRHNHRDSNSSLDRAEYHYTSDSVGSRSGGSSPDYGSRRYLMTAQQSSRHTDTAPPRAHYSRHHPRRH